MIDFAKIRAAFEAQPLCEGVLTRKTDDGKHERCAVGALLAALGVGDEELSEAHLEVQGHKYYGTYADGLWQRYGDQLHAAYGIPGATALQDIISANDGIVVSGEVDEEIGQNVALLLDELADVLADR